MLALSKFQHHKESSPSKNQSKSHTVETLTVIKPCYNTFCTYFGKISRADYVYIHEKRKHFCLPLPREDRQYLYYIVSDWPTYKRQLIGNITCTQAPPLDP